MFRDVFSQGRSVRVEATKVASLSLLRRAEFLDALLDEV